MTTTTKTPWRTPGYGVKGADTRQFNAWAEYADGARYEYTGSGPECNTWMCAERRAGATRCGYAAAA